MQESADPIESRVERSLHRNSYKSVSVAHLGDGRVKLTGNSIDHAVVIAIAKSVPGVREVVSELK